MRKYPKRRKGSKYRSGLESKIAKQLSTKKIPILYETVKLAYSKPISQHIYTPDFVLPSGVIIEAKGLFSSADRKKHLLVQEQHPTLDIRFVFSYSCKKLYKGSKTTYADWCDKHGFIYADKLIPKEWFNV
tara:strand:+ start:1940 stop:2332 length:393 start_codon:yes stop_codon:yes gene_type:complete